MRYSHRKPENIDKVLEFKTPVLLNDIICVTNGTVEDHEPEILSKLQDSGYRASETKTGLFKSDLTWLGSSINRNGMKPIKDETEAITKLKALNSTKERKSFFESIQPLSKVISKISKTN